MDLLYNPIACLFSLQGATREKVFIVCGRKGKFESGLDAPKFMLAL